MKEMRNKSLKPPCLCLWLWGEPGLGSAGHQGLGSESPGHHRTVSPQLWHTKSDGS